MAKHLNVEIGQNLRQDRWVGADFWAQAVDETLTLDTLLKRSEVVIVGIDGGGLDDLLGLAVLGRERTTSRWLLWGHAYAHISVLRRRKSIASALIDFAKTGDLEIFDAFGPLDPGALADAIDKPDRPAPCPEAPRSGLEGQPHDDIQDGATLPPDVRALVALVEKVMATGLLAEVDMDPAGVGLIAEGLRTIGVLDSRDEAAIVPLWGVSQGWTLNGAIKTAERKLADGTLLHADQALMSFAVGNARTAPAGNATLITKAVSGTAKIDPLMAALSAIARMTKNPEPAGSVYSADRGLRSFG